MQHAAGTAEAGIFRDGSTEVLTGVGVIASAAGAPVRLALFKLRMVRRRAVAEHQDVLVRTQRHALGIQKTRGPRLLPYPLVPEPGEVAHAEYLVEGTPGGQKDRKSTRLNSSHLGISYAVFCLKKKK